MHLKSFLLIFGFPELNIFLKRWLLLSFLTLILGLSLICIGFSEGTSHFLKEKMDNPFIRFVSVTVPASQAADPSFQVDLQKPVVKKRYQYDQLEMIATRMVNFRGINGKQPAAFVRHIKPGDELYKFLLQEPGVVLSDQVVPIENHPWSCIVTEAYLKKLGYSDFNVSYLDYIHPGVSDHFTPIPIAAIVKQLPDNHDLFVSDELFEAFEGTKENNLIDTAHSDHQTYLRAFIETELDEKQLKAKLNSDFPAALVERATETIKPGLMIRINNLEGLTPVQGYQKLALELKGDNIIRTFDFGRPVLSPKAYTDKIVFYFSQLDSIRPFQSYLLDKHKLKIDMNTIEAKENFNLFDKIITIMSLVLSLFSIILIVYVITSLVLEHIEKNNKNLGTLKAFGLSNTNITMLYTGIALTLILGIFSISFLAARITGDFITGMVISLFGIKLSHGITLFHLRLTFPLIMSFLALPVSIVAGVLYRKLYNKTPGDLIYERA